ncbi:hemolysin-type calcium-binding repeat 2 copies family protein [Asticcacaulis biprosthecium C19]|uniref:Hemolysin-type calcium-binding repeat 2 copies family protein n=1 Tax=Asticcacaulis biprosthecium C19 TaxID=715226 RepID=F4QNG3_9CAUL|nr:calcium-binding protein [Asticcacaulis biprosthecium]EGF90871.1 hemolysin-type calcium-binding repeat 2 copies family protein [Asticcacaulis biprosthecium C19]
MGRVLGFKSAVAALNSGAGDDTYIVDSVDDVVVENFNEGTDTVFAFISYDLTDNVENLWLSGDAVLTGRGNALNNILTGNNTVNYLLGGLGDDTYYIQNSGDMVEEAHHQGTDTIYSTVSYSLFGRAVENFIMLGDDDLVVWGNSLDNLLVGNTGDNLFQGEAGADTMQGGDGNDTYIITATSDVVVELENGGYDLVQSTARTTILSANIENLTLMGDPLYHQEGTGNALGNILMSAHSGSSVLRGGAGNDTYYLNGNFDFVEEEAGEGYDVIYSTASVTIAGQYVERVELTGTANTSINGNSIRNVMIGNSGNNIFSGWGGGDYIEGGLGNDVYYIWDVRDTVVERAGEGTDTIYSEVSYDLAGRHVEVLNLGRGAINGTGNSLANTLRGGDGNNILNGLGGHDRLDGFGGADTLIGGTGNDTYVVDGSDDVVTELPGEGRDLVQSSFSYSLGAGLEDLTLTGMDAINGTGDDLGNVLTGNSGNNILSGGLGDDTYYIQNTGDNVVEVNGQGTDTIYSSVTYALTGRYVEILTLTGSANLNATGNSFANTLIGNDGNNRLNGKAGSDILEGGLGSDTFLFEAGSGADVIRDFNASQNDSINLNAYTGGIASDSSVAQSGTDVIITLAGGGNVITVQDALRADVLGHIVW